MTRAEIIVLNERVKAVSHVFFNLATALAAATATRVYLLGTMDISATTWSMGIVALVFVGWKVLYLLETEPEE